MRVKMTRVLYSALFAMTLLALAPVTEAAVTINHKVMDAAGKSLIGGTIALTNVGLEDALYRAKDDDNNGAVTFSFQDGDPNLNTDLIAWHYDANGVLKRRELWVIRDAKLVKANELLLDYGPSESSYCSPSCDMPSSVVDGGDPVGWTIPALLLLLLVFL